MTKANGFEVVDRADVPNERPGPGRRPTAISVALESGQTVWTTDAYAVIATRSKRGYLGNRGLIVRQQKAQRKGVTGWYLWTEVRP